MKFKPIHPERDRYDFVAADTLVDFAKRHDMQVRGHTLVWYQSEPDIHSTAPGCGQNQLVRIK